VSWPAYSEAGVTIEQRALDDAARILAADCLHSRRQDVRALQTRLAALKSSAP